MKPTNIIKKSLSINEVIEEKFSLSPNYLKLKVIFSLLIWLFIFGLIFFIIYYLGSNWQKLLGSVIGNSIFLTEATQVDFNSFEGGAANSFNPLPLATIMLGIFLLFILPAVLFYNFYYLRISNEFVFTNKRLLVKRGWLNTKLVSINYNRITDVSIKQYLIDRILKIGSLSVSTAGNDGYRVVLVHIQEPHLLKSRLHDLKESYRQLLQSTNQLDDLQQDPN